MQYSLKSLIVVVLLVAVFCALASAFPPVQFVGLMLALLMTVLLPYMASQGGMVLMGLSDRRDVFPFLSTFSSSANTPTLPRAWTAFLFSTILLIATYPLAREIGSSFSLLSFGVDDLQISLDSAFQRTARRLSMPDLWRILYVWGSIHAAKWTIFFALLTCIFGLGFARRGELKHLFSRLLYFSPWIIVLHALMLIGVWMDDPSITGPEGSGWHWGCAIEPTWLKRLAIPMAFVGYAYFSYVLRFRSTYAVLFAIGIIPLAIMATAAVNELGHLLV